MLLCALRGTAGRMKLWYNEIYQKSRAKGSEGCWRSEVGGQRKRGFASPGVLRGQALLGLTFFRLLSSSSSWRIRTSLVVSSSFSRRSSSCCRKNIRRSCVEKVGNTWKNMSATAALKTRKEDIGRMKDETFGFNGKLCKAGFILSFFLKSFAPVHYALLLWSKAVEQLLHGPHEPKGQTALKA